MTIHHLTSTLWCVSLVSTAFPVNLLTMTVLTRKLECCVKLSHCTLQRYCYCNASARCEGMETRSTMPYNPTDHNQKYMVYVDFYHFS